MRYHTSSDPRSRRQDNYGLNHKQLQDLDHWPPNSGYLDYITDNRNQHYWRAYVGQSEAPLLRIKHHMRTIYSGDHDTLHYYIVHKGSGHRQANFIRLWTIVYPPTMDTSVLVVTSNVLEMVMTRAFQSHLPEVLEKYFGGPPDMEGSKYSGVGLNIVPPQSGFTKSDSLIWTFNFRRYILSPESFEAALLEPKRQQC
ncbi:hypothetical protein T310_4698 [Rasamsonia emersonii CBS 393.64]|uniref:Uncharacterized protein n=1 Tax=Rasamsonia emersonii (strain ATCC 16479 / CBS 393.64 / IMI 116815) TaxID=1408163 RepID=A0A0F4YSK6_RASE3|nr:hypothetical protein T310_4698 [Rasamsonia emersonii CBS 393.64]KKA21257.1 hypothetical protein T310_4698 [Rasamsonia emersonii CBS 393.64]